MSDPLSSPPKSPGRNDGHVEGHLNCVAVRHGWTRTFSISPAELANFDYATLEAILELNTLRLRTSHLRIYVENPQGSGNYSKIRFWKDDGSLQSVLVRDFFEGRRRGGGLTRIEIRDGHDREDPNASTISLRHLTMSPNPGGSSKFLQRTANTKDWFRRRGWELGGSASAPDVRMRRGDTDDEEEGEDITPASELPDHNTATRRRTVPPSRTRAILSFFGFVNPEPPTPPPQTKSPEEMDQAQREEEMDLRKHGWLPPILRRGKTASSAKAPSVKSSGTKKQRVGRITSQSSNPFFGASTSSLGHSHQGHQDPFRDPPTAERGTTEQDDNDIHIVEHGDSEDEGQEMSPMNTPGKEKSGWRFRANATPSNSKKRGKGKQKQQRFAGAEVIRTPQDAFDTLKKQQ